VSSSLAGLVGLVGLVGLAGACASSTAGREPEQARREEPAAPGKPPGQARSRASFEPEGGVFLSAIPLRASPRAKALAATSKTDHDFARGLRVRLGVMPGYRELGELTKRSKVTLVNGTFQLSDLSGLGARELPSTRDQKSSFVIDYDEVAFTGPAAELERSGKARSASAISAFASEYISEKTYIHSFDVASRVAAKRSGDCTEHAVFTTALLRRFGFKARVLLGIVLVGVAAPETEPELFAFGHAWVELHEKGAWRVVDTALGDPENPARGMPSGVRLRLAYLPITVLRNETASFSRALMDQAGVETVTGVELDATGAAP
jgi:hypothetical protein